jgi:hypothetical protein
VAVSEIDVRAEDSRDVLIREDGLIAFKKRVLVVVAFEDGFWWRWRRRRGGHFVSAASREDGADSKQEYRVASHRGLLVLRAAE